MDYLRPSSIVAALFAGLVLWILVRLGTRWLVDRRFDATVKGGRTGTITIASGGRTARAEYEVGATVYFLTYGSSLAWANGEPLNAQQRTEVVQVLRRWAKERGSTLEVENDG